MVKEESHTAENEIPSSSAPWQVLPGSAVLPVHETVTSDLTSNHQATTIDVDVSEALQRICNDEKVEQTVARAMLKALVSQGRQLDVHFDGNAMHVCCDAVETKAIQDIVDRIQQHGMAQLSVALYFASVPQSTFESLDIQWRSNWNQLACRSDDSDISVPSPTLTALVPLESAPALREIIHVLQAPKVTLFNGQYATIRDSTERPFVVNVMEPAEVGMALQPVIQVVSEGLTMDVLPVLNEDGQTITLDCRICRNRIEEVDTLTFKHVTAIGVSSDATLKAESVTLQVPRVSGQTLSVKQLQVPRESAVLLAGLPAVSRGEKRVTIAMIEITPIRDSIVSQSDSDDGDGLGAHTHGSRGFLRPVACFMYSHGNRQLAAIQIVSENTQRQIGVTDDTCSPR